jgi:hypothetical protein
LVTQFKQGHHIMAFRTIWNNASNKGKDRLGSKAKKTDFNGRKYDSKFEASFAAQLEQRRKAKSERDRVVDVKPQHKIELRVAGKLWRNYRIDFRVECADGTIEYIEVKGYATEEWKMKWDLLNILQHELLEPGAELILVTK